ncbi:hypothetical protein A1O3_04622 [Capronia epimyces CBS 606.96]|uniref:Uncharacterized protein n=1 Tax=Capronia epimyces CBS 606.96 TaxID=1182542 RepID=W9Y2V6_9EURO|nr:uncharacterized protein A1O3_04622 [Capronia epimyces CBS 606.96]EXJ83955.1 hypothetical protein A1O3_04622 [Capronia epimyces CBS 606.96]
MDLFYAHFLLFCLCLASVARSQSVTSTSTTSTPTSTKTTTASTSIEPCAQVSSRISSSLAADASATSFHLPPQLARDCSLSVPIVKQDALDLVDSLSAWLESQSTLAYLKNPPQGYLMNSVDLLGGLEDIRNKVSNGSYSGEVPFQNEIANLVASAHDGHLAFIPDTTFIFLYERTIGNLLSVSLDGNSLPEIYSYNDLALAHNTTLSWKPSPLRIIDGQDVLSWLRYQALNTTAENQDPDAAWNAMFYELVSPVGTFPFVVNGFPGTSNNVTFANGTSRVFPIIASTDQDFTNVTDGKSFYQAFCNATVKMDLASASAAATATTVASSSSSSSTSTRTPQPSGSNPDFSKPGFPSPVVSDGDSTLAGYFLNAPGYEGTAVLSVFSFDPADTQSFIDALTFFLDECRRENKTHLVIDVSGNGGGNILLAFETFKQLFPSVDPYLTSSRRANSQLEVLTKFFSTFSTMTRENVTAFLDAGGDSDYDATSLDNSAGQAYATWKDYWHPFEVHNDSFTPLARYNLSNVLGSEVSDGLVVSGYGNNTGSLSPRQPFPSENVIVVTDGQCASSCHSFSHMLKWQGKVKTVAVGGRPQTGPMQYVGGVKGSEVTYLADVLQYIDQFYTTVTDHDTIKQANRTGLKTLQDLGNYLLYRTVEPQTSSYASINFNNFISQYDWSYTPLQFVYEAADCRVWYSLDMVFDITAVWKRAAQEAFAIGPNSTHVFAGCIQGSTNASSSLSGNVTLFNSGKVANVTTFVPSTFTKDANQTESKRSAPVGRYRRWFGSFG